ncbi:hypothetical protein MGLY_20190 [Neomoorella glycerini]|uniref:DUF433 domain-containing protein n=1 Tax=Neomoorella glycerini TaxID=55779 RepID=A0A6I5ZRL1_9FIRM|nr:DUF433 domain-containing protein [Moorella glycerini]QGP92632.1 hypothetical protein MGLY_20190 [Moorella glycerini]
MQEVMPGIIVDPLIKGGKPVIKGTRVPVELIVGKLAGGLTYKEIMAEYDLKKKISWRHCATQLIYWRKNK